MKVLAYKIVMRATSPIMKSSRVELVRKGMWVSFGNAKNVVKLAVPVSELDTLSVRNAVMRIASNIQHAPSKVKICPLSQCLTSKIAALLWDRFSCLPY